MMTEPQRYRVYLKSTGEEVAADLDPEELHDFFWSGKRDKPWWKPTRHPQWRDLRAIEMGLPFPDDGNAYSAALVDQYASSGELW